MPASNSSHMGTASSICETTSGGVSSMPTMKHPKMTNGRFCLRLWGGCCTGPDEQHRGNGDLEGESERKK